MSTARRRQRLATGMGRGLAVPESGVAKPSAKRDASTLVAQVDAWSAAALKLFTTLVGLAVAIVAVVVVADARNYRGLVVEPFAVPDSLEAEGLTGQAVAAQVLDQLAYMQAESESIRASQSYSNDWGEEIKFEIPQTGVSIGELQRFLRGWLGQQVRISGAVLRGSTEPSGAIPRDGGPASTRAVDKVTIIARSGASPGTPQEGSIQDLQALARRAAEGIYRDTQPYRYAVYLNDRGRRAEAAAVYEQLAKNAKAVEAAWGYRGLALLAQHDLDARKMEVQAQRALSLAPRLTAAVWTLSQAQDLQGHWEAAVDTARRTHRLTARRNRQLTPMGQARLAIQSELTVARMTGDFAKASRLYARDAGVRGAYRMRLVPWKETRIALAAHDMSRAVAVMPPARGLPTNVLWQRNLWLSEIYLAQGSTAAANRLQRDSLAMIKAGQAVAAAAETAATEADAAALAAQTLTATAQAAADAAADAAEDARANRMNDPRRAEAAAQAAEAAATSWSVKADRAYRRLIVANRLKGSALITMMEFAPTYARTLAHAGEPSAARALISQLPSDCYPCTVARGDVESILGQVARADAWYAKAVALAPSLPLAHQAWAESYRMRGDFDAAMREAGKASQLGPNWADPLTLQGEILLARGRPGQAERRFRQAACRAPQWAHNRVLWAAAVERAGRTQEAARLRKSGSDLRIPDETLRQLADPKALIAPGKLPRPAPVPAFC